MIPISPGDTFGRLTVLRLADRRLHSYRMYHCRCECGGMATVRADVLKNGGTRSCGCLRREMGYAKAAQLTAHLNKPEPPKDVPQNKARRRSARFPLEPVDWPVRSRLVFRALRRQSLTRRQIEERTLLRGDAVAEALEHLMRVDFVRETRRGKEWVYGLTLDIMVNL